MRLYSVAELCLQETLKYTEPTNRDNELLRDAIKVCNYLKKRVKDILQRLDELTKAASERMRLEENSKSVLRVSAMLDPPVEVSS